MYYIICLKNWASYFTKDNKVVSLVSMEKIVVGEEVVLNDQDVVIMEKKSSDGESVPNDKCDVVDVVRNKKEKMMNEK